MIETRGLHHIHLVVRDAERAKQFYVEVFGMKELFRGGPKMIFLQTPGSRDLITLNEDARERANAGQSGGISHFGFQLASGGTIDDAVREVERAGGKLLSRGEHAPGVPFAYVADLDGYTIEIGNP
jgi:catechol 2,3-dioxygenase-like lactoylglutathione lyase family enzyme